MVLRLATKLKKWTVDKLSALLPSHGTISSDESSNSAMEDFERLERTIKRTQSTLFDAPNGFILDRSQKHRLEELREIAYDAEDLVEEHAYEVLHTKMQGQNELGEKVTSKLSSIDISIPVSEELAMRAKKIRERFDEIAGDWEKLKWGENDGVRRPNLESVMRPPTSSLVYEPSIHGRHQDKENIIAILLNQPNDCSKDRIGHCVLPIVGMGGVGKTTLAQVVYNDYRMDSYFDLKGWIYVSKMFDVQTLTQEIVRCLTKRPCEPMQINGLHRVIEENIKGKKLLLVLDDVWNEKRSLWSSLQTPLFFSQSCTILVTTRNEKVAKIMQTIPFYSLRCLEQEESWQLFRRAAFENQDLDKHASLLEIGRKITEKCGGLPLAIRAIGCALRFEPGEEFWRAILRSDLWEQEAGLNEVLPALQLSYDCMPENLKQCFMSFSLFPKNYVFSKESTIRFWSSLGFLKLDCRKSEKDTGSQYFDDLKQRSMLQKFLYDEQNSFFQMHDLLLELAEFVAGDSFRKLNIDILKSCNDKSRYLSVLVNELPKSVDLNLMQHSNSLRALQIFNTVNSWLGKDISIELNEGFFQNLRSLRVLNFNNTGIRTLPSSIGNLKQLRFMGLARTKIETLPESIGFLYNMQTMDLSECHLEELPKGLRNLVNLQHLIVSKWSNIQMPSGIGCLTNLELLPVFNIGIGSSCEISEMGKLSKLCGELRISGLNYVQHLKDIVLADLFNKKHIDVLVLDWSHGVPQTGNYSSVLSSDMDHGKVLEALQPQLNLLQLEIYHYPGLSYPKWLGDFSYSRLGKIVLFGNCKLSYRFLPPLGRLPSLKDLSIQFMLTVEHVGDEFCGQNEAFPSLSTLEFKYMPRWGQWYWVSYRGFCSLKTLKLVSCNELQFMPKRLSNSLEKLVLNHCSKLASIPTLNSLTSLILMGNIDKSLLTSITLPSLKSLQIGFSQNMQYVMLGLMPLLEVLIIKGCKNLKSLFGLTGLMFLRELELDECPSLMLPIDEHTPPLLKILKVTNCPGLHYWEKNQRKTPEESYRRDTSTDDVLPAFGDDYNSDQLFSITQKSSEYDKVEPWLTNWLSKSSDEGKQVNAGKNDEFQPTLPTVGDDYNSDWLFSVTQKSSEYGNLEPSLTKWLSKSSDKGKQVWDNSSGISIASASDNELGSFGGTSEDDWS